MVCGHCQQGLTSVCKSDLHVYHYDNCRYIVHAGGNIVCIEVTVTSETVSAFIFM